LGNQNKQAQKIAQGQIHDNKRQFFLRKGNLQFFPIPAQSKKTRDNFFIWEDNLQLFFFMLAQSQREGRTSTSHNKQRKSCVNTSHDFMLAQITINKGY